MVSLGACKWSELRFFFFFFFFFFRISDSVDLCDVPTSLTDMRNSSLGIQVPSQKALGP